MQATEAAIVLREHDYTVEVRHADGAPYAVLPSHHERAVPAVIAHMTKMLGQFADHGGTFDGWEAAVTP